MGTASPTDAGAPMGRNAKRPLPPPRHLRFDNSNTKADIATNLGVSLLLSILHILTKGIFRGHDWPAVNGVRMASYSADFGKIEGCAGIIVESTV